MQKTDGITNFFVHQSAAKRYAAARPYFHPLVAAKIIEFTRVPRFASALDVACGTGQSARSLVGISDGVEAIDVSSEMIAEAEPCDRVKYQTAPAEQMPFADAVFDLATVGLAFHWFDQAAFLREAWRVLKPNAWLVVYTSGFAGEMTEDATFRNWAWDVYTKRFPTPARGSVGVTEKLVSAHGFKLRDTEEFAHDENMSVEQLTGYLLTQTNVIAAVESGTVSLPEATAWITDGVRPFFQGRHRTMKFKGAIWYLRRNF